MLKFLESTVLITGHYGSGKTNLAVNLAMDFAAAGEQVVLCDLDIVNPYFRSSDFRAQAQEAGIELVAPVFAGSNVDAPALGARLDALIPQQGKRLIIDVGGDDAGAAALGRYSNALTQRGGYSFLYVVNQRRPLVAQPQDAVQVLGEIEAASRMKATGLVNNTHLCGLTEAKTVSDSGPYAEEISRLSGLPLLMTAVERSLAPQVEAAGEIYPVTIWVKLPWEK